MKNFEIGKPYFRLTFSDKECSIPFVATFIYIGTSLSESDPDGILYFQPADDFEQHGSILDSSHGSSRMRCLAEDAACEEMLSPNELSHELLQL